MTTSSGPRSGLTDSGTTGPGPRVPVAVEIRPARPEEHEEAGRVTRDAFAGLYGEQAGDYLDRVAAVAGRAGRTTVLVAVVKGRIVGSITVELTAKVDVERELLPGEAHLRMLGVARDAQGRGVGEALVTAATALAREAGKARVTLGTMPEMTAAQRLYGRVGFRAGPPVEHAPGQYHLAYEMDLEPPVNGD